MFSFRDFLPDYPAYDDPLFQQKILDKKEFRDLKLGRDLEKIAAGEKLLHQTIVERYLSEHTPYDTGLIYHEMGTGKTCVAFALSEALKKSGVFKRCYVIARGADLLKNLMRSLVYSCSTNYPIEKITGDDRAEMAAIRAAVKKFYGFHTMLVFAKELSGYSDESIVAKYSNAIFVVDEVHNIRGGDSNDALVYFQFWRLFHTARNVKILLMSGTPMRDEVSEIAYVMNLILPANQQLPTGKNFDAKFITGSGMGVQIANQPVLRSYFSGRISYLKAARSVPFVFERRGYDDPIPIAQFNMVASPMSAHQSAAYMKAYAADTGENQTIYLNSRQASLFVFPDGSYGAAGLERYVTRARGKSGFVLNQTLAAELRTVKGLRKYSVKYADTIETIQGARRKIIFVYLPLVAGSGANLFAKILELYGYERSTGRERQPGKRYILLTSQTAAIARLISYSNNSRNKFGDYCQVIIGSRKISEGFTFKNVQIVDIEMMHWNNTETSQALARASRFQSHSALLAVKSIAERGLFVRVHQRAAIPAGNVNKAIDMIMMRVSRNKDVAIRRMDRVIKESAFDCPLNYERNSAGPGGIDGTRECDYQDCKYVCATTGGPNAAETIDLSTFELYYDTFFTLVQPIVDIFHTRDAYSFGTLYELLAPNSEKQLLRALAYIIQNSLIIINRYSYPCFLRESDNTYYLVRESDIIGAPGQNGAGANIFAIQTARSVARPLFSKQKTLAKVTAARERQVTLELFNELEEAKTAQDVRGVVEKIPRAAQIIVLQVIFEAKISFGRTSERGLQIVEALESLVYFPAGKTDYAVVLIGEGEYNSCYRARDKTWVNCLLKRPREVVSVEEPLPSEEPLPLGEPQPPLITSKYRGIVDGDKFCIQDLSKAVGQKDKRRIYTGSQCEMAGWKKQALIDICTSLKVPGPGAEENVDQFWSRRSKKEICGSIKAFFKQNRLLVSGACGTARKKKI